MTLTRLPNGRFVTSDRAPVLTVAEAAYIAGIIDGEGWLGWLNPGKGRGRKRPQVQVASIDNELVEWLHKTCGGFMPKARPASERRQPLYQWRIQGPGAVSLLLQVRDYLRIERRQKKADELLSW